MTAVKICKVTCIFREPMLGTVPGNKELYTDFIKSKAPEVPHDPEQKPDDEVTTVQEDIENASTIFHRDEQGRPFIYNYMV